MLLIITQATVSVTFNCITIFSCVIDYHTSNCISNIYCIIIFSCVIVHVKIIQLRRKITNS